LAEVVERLSKEFDEVFRKNGFEANGFRSEGII
jgi:hypothetical protein